MIQSYMTLPLTITVILFLLISTLVVYVFDILNKPIWNTPQFIPLVFIIPFILTGWLPLGFYGLYLSRIEKSKFGPVILLSSILWIIAVIVLISCTMKSLIDIFQNR